MLEFEYAHLAPKNGLKMEQNRRRPYKFGLVGSTDAHTALAAVEEDNFFGKHAGAEPDLPGPRIPLSSRPAARSSWAGNDRPGYAAVWATENTREALFDAMKRRETYATTGPRIPCAFLAAGISRQKTRTTACWRRSATPGVYRWAVI